MTNSTTSGLDNASTLDGDDLLLVSKKSEGTYLSRNVKYSVIQNAINKVVTDLSMTKRIQDANELQLGAEANRWTELLISATNGKTQKFINEQWLDFAPYVTANATTNTAAINALIAVAKSTGKGIRCAPCGVVNFNDNVDFSGIRNIEFRTDISMDNGKRVTIGGFAQTAPACSFIFYNVVDKTSVFSATTPTNVVLRIAGAKGAKIQVGACNYLQLYADAADLTTWSTAYNEITLTGVVALYEMLDSGVLRDGLGGWITENRTNGGRIIRCYITGVSYTPNHNKFSDNTFEGASVDIKLVKATNNLFTGVRLEDGTSTAKVSFDANSSKNKIIQTWSGSGSPRTELSFTANVTDNGAFNVCTTEMSMMTTKVQLFAVQGRDLISDGVTCASTNANFGRPKINLTALPNFTPHLIGFDITANRLIALSDLVPVKFGDVINFDCDYVGSLMRPVFWCYDANQKLITNGTGVELISMPSVALTASEYVSTSAALTAASMAIGGAIARSDIKYVQVGVYASVVGFVKNIVCNLYTQNLGRGKAQAAAVERTVIPQLANDVTKGFVQLGYTVYNTTTKMTNRVIFALDTYTTAAAASGATSIDIKVATGIKNGDIVGIQLDDGTTHWSKVSSLSGTTHSIAALPSAAAANNRVVYNRWAAINAIVTLNSATYAVGMTVLTYTVVGAAIGQKVTVGHNKSLGALFIKGDVTAADTVTVTIFNPTASSVAVAGGSIYISVE